MSIKNAIRKIAWKITGLNDLQKQLDSLQFYFSTCHDISKFPKAEGTLRELQEADTLLAAAIAQVLEKHGLQYWLDGGTLLGAVRHRGFIPWDDDIDLCVPRKDYENALKFLRQELTPYGIDVEECAPLGWIGVGHLHGETGIWADVFVMDACTADAGDPAAREKLIRELHAYRQQYLKLRAKGADRDRMLEAKRAAIPELCPEERANSLFYTMELNADFEEYHVILGAGDMFPLQPAEFEGRRFMIPRNPDAYLKAFYGDYTGYPADSGSHHTTGEGSLAEQVRRKGTDLQAMIRELKEINEKLGGAK